MNKRAFSVGYRKPILIEDTDPRANGLNRYISKLGREVVLKNFNGTKKLASAALTEWNPESLLTHNYWISLYNKGPGVVLRSCVVDSQKNVYAVGGIGNFASYSTDLAGLIIKYDTNRNVVWGKTLSAGSGGWTTVSDASGGVVNIFDMQIDSSSNIYVVGNYKSGSIYNTFLAKYNKDGTLLFQRVISSQNSNLGEILPRIALDSLGNVYLTASYTASSVYVLLFKYSSSGSLIWQKKIYAPNVCYQAAITTDSSNNIIMCTTHVSDLSSFNKQRFTFLKIDSNGSILSQVCFKNSGSGLGASAQYLPLKLICDNNGNIYLSMLTWANVLGSDDHIQRPFLMKLDSTFTPIWQKAPAESGSTSWQSWADGLDVDSQGNVYWGVYRGLYTAIIYKLDSNGNQIFANNIALGFPYGDVSVYGTYIDNATLYVCGAGYDGPARLPYTLKVISDTSLLGSYPFSSGGGYPSTYNFSYNALAVSLKDIGYYTTTTAELLIDSGSITESAGSFSPFSLTYGETGRYLELQQSPTLVPSIQNIIGETESYLVTSGLLPSEELLGSISYSISGEENLPTGLNFNTLTGVISGTPTASLAQNIFTITATDNFGTHANSVLNLMVLLKAKILPLSQTIYGEIDTPLSSLAFTPNSRFVGPVTYSLSGGSLPTGLSFDTSTGVISGTPTTTLSQTNFTVTANGIDAFSTNVSADAEILLSVLVKAEISPASQTLTAIIDTEITPTTAFTPNSRFVGTVTYALSGGILPVGLSFDTSTGVISGTPLSALEETEFIVTASGLDVYNQNVSATATIDISVLDEPKITPETQEIMTLVNVAITPTIAYTPNAVFNGVVTYTLIPPAGRSLPTGLSFDTSTGVISGTPTSTLGTTVFTVQADDAFGTTANAIITITVTSTILVITPEIINTPGLTDSASITTLNVDTINTTDSLSTSLSDTASLETINILSATASDAVSINQESDSVTSAESLGIISTSASDNITSPTATDSGPTAQLQ